MSHSKFRRFAQELSAVGLASLVFSASAFAQEPSTSTSGWKPFFKDNKGNESPFPSDAAQVNDKQWMFLRFTDYAGFKPRIAVMVAGNQKPEQQYWSWLDGSNTYRIPITSSPSAAGVPVDGIEDLVTIALRNANRFHLIERE